MVNTGPIVQAIQGKKPLAKKMSIRLAVIHKVRSGDKSVRQAALELGITEGHVRKLDSKLRKKGDKGLLLLWSGKKLYSYNAYKYDYFIRDILPSVYLRPKEKRRLDTFVKLMLRGVELTDTINGKPLKNQSILIRMAAESLGVSEKEIYRIQRKAFTEGFWRILSRKKQNYLLTRFPELTDSCTPQQFCGAGFNFTKTKEENRVRDLTYELVGEKMVALRTSKKSNFNPFFDDGFGIKQVTNRERREGGIGEATGEDSGECRTLYKDPKLKDSLIKTPNVKDSKFISFYSFSDGEGKLKDFTSCEEKAKAAIFKRDEDKFSHANLIKMAKAAICGVGKYDISRSEFVAYLGSAKAYFLAKTERDEETPKASTCELEQQSNEQSIPVVALNTETDPILNSGIFEDIIQERVDGQIWHRLKDDSFLDVTLLRRDLGETAPAINIDPQTEVNCSACGTQQGFHTMSLHKYVANVILCSNCNVLLRGRQYTTLRTMTKKLIDCVASSSKRRWIGWDSRVRSYLEFINTPTTIFTLQQRDKSFDVASYYNPFMADIMAKGKPLKAKKGIAERERHQLEAIENQKKSEIAEKEKQEHYRIYKQKIADGRLPIEISFEIYMQMLPEIEREDRTRERQRMKAEREAERIKNDPVYAAEVMAKEKALLAESDAMLREIYESEKAYAGY